jgi:hypothetical protein
MAEITKYSQSNTEPIEITKDGDYYISFKGGLRSKCAVSYSNSQGTAPAGVLSFDFEKNGGDPPAVLDLALFENTFAYDVPVPSLHLNATGIPSQSRLLIYFS